jgi:hypothetical protein
MGGDSQFGATMRMRPTSILIAPTPYHYTTKNLFIATHDEEMYKQINLVANHRVLVATSSNPRP